MIKAEEKLSMIRRLDSKQKSFEDDFANLVSVSEPDQARISEIVKQIIEDVKLNGDFAVQNILRNLMEILFRCQTNFIRW